MCRFVGLVDLTNSTGKRQVGKKGAAIVRQRHMVLAALDGLAEYLFIVFVEDVILILREHPGKLRKQEGRIAVQIHCVLLTIGLAPLFHGVKAGAAVDFAPYHVDLASARNNGGVVVAAIICMVRVNAQRVARAQNDIFVVELHGQGHFFACMRGDTGYMVFSCPFLGQLFVQFFFEFEFIVGVGRGGPLKTLSISKKI